MTATANPISTSRYGAGAIPNQLHAPQKALGTIRVGTITCLEAGYATEGRTALGLIAIGIAYGRGNLALGVYDNSAGANGDIEVVVDQGVFPLKNSSAADQITQADAGKTCYIVDNQTVAKTSGNNTRSPCGRVAWVDGDGIPWVQIGLPRSTPAETGASGADLVLVGTDMAPAALVHEATYDIPTLAANSTVTLPTAAPVNTRVFFTADGIKNGFTVTYRDGAGNVALAAATTASKRHQAMAIRGKTNWTLIVGVSP